MAFVMNIWFMVLLGMVIGTLETSTYAEPQVPCYMIFGDSQVDNGNNNNLITQAKANYFPYGIDYCNVSTGRFTNGRNAADILGELLGFSHPIPPFVTARGRNITRGVNYGSGASGIRDETGNNWGDHFSFNRQLLNHINIIARIETILGNKTAEYLTKCLYTVTMGSNDYINNYLMPNYYPTSRLYTPEQYATILIQEYSLQLRILYKLFARKIAIFSIGLLGCIPSELAKYPANQSGCVDFINAEVQLFNTRLKMLVDELNSNFTDAKFVFINSTNIGMLDPAAAGTTVLNAPCCNVSTTIAKGQCVPGQAPCSKRNTFVFYDFFHTTEIINLAATQRAYTALSPLDAYPYDISTLVQQ